MGQVGCRTALSLMHTEPWDEAAQGDLRRDLAGFPTAQPQPVQLYWQHPWMIILGHSCSSPSTSQHPEPSRPKGQDEHPGLTKGKGVRGPRLTFLRLEEAVLTQLGQERTASAGGLEVAQGNV